jgi:hypothetical protein
MKITWICAIIWSLAALRGAPLDAQATSQPDTVQHRNNCRLAVQVLTTGQPANKRYWALAYASTCGPVGGPALAHALEQNRRSATPEALEEVVMVTSEFHDATIFRTALDIARDASSTKAARIQALRVLYYQLGRGRVDPYESFLAAETGEIYLIRPDYPCGVGEPLPADAAQQTLRAAEAIEQRETDADLRAAARKVSGAARSSSHAACC